MLVLVVEPTRLYQKILSSLLEGMGFTVEVTRSANDALNMLSAQRFDLVCTAMHIDGMSGIDLAQKIRESEMERQLPVVLLTTEDDKTILGHALQAGVTEIYQKGNTDSLERYLRYLVNLGGDYQHMIGKVLYVEDESELAELVIQYMEATGLEVEHYTNAEQALQAYQDREFDLVLTDFFLSGKMTGSDLLGEVRAMSPAKARVPVLVVSSFDDDSRKLGLLKSGANDYITKPILQQELQLRVSNMVKSKQLLDRLEEQHESLKTLAMTDQLTSLYNRHYLVDTAPKHLSEARRHNYPLSVVVIDLDHFKSINDTHGHTTGDVVLRETGKLLANSVRDEDIVARFGGEEFVALLTHCDLQSALKKTEDLRAKLEALKPAGLTVTGSFGVASFDPERHDDFPQIFSDADKAVYEAKDSGRNCVKFFGK